MSYTPVGNFDLNKCFKNIKGGYFCNGCEFDNWLMLSKIVVGCGAVFLRIQMPLILEPHEVEGVVHNGAIVLLHWMRKLSDIKYYFLCRL